MAKNEVTDWDENAPDNLDVSGISLAENVMRAPAVNNAFRATMAQVARLESGATLASAATTNLGSIPARYVTITGTTTITALGTLKAGTLKFVTFEDALTLTHDGAALILPTGDDILTAAGDTAVFVSEGAGNWRCLVYQRGDGTAVEPPPPQTFPPPKGYIFGLGLSNNATDASSDIDIAVGEASSDDDPPIVLKLTSALTKQLDAAWAVGTNQGMLDTGSVGNSTYYLWLIRRSDTGVVDVLASLSASAPTMPANYDQKRMIGFVVRAAGANLAPHRDGQELYFESSELAITSAGSATVAHGLNQPPKRVEPVLICVIADAGYSIGDIVRASMQTSTSQADVYGASIEFSGAQNILVKFSGANPMFLTNDKTSGGPIGLVNASWHLILRAWA